MPNIDWKRTIRNLKIIWEFVFVELLLSARQKLGLRISGKSRYVAKRTERKALYAKALMGGSRGYDADRGDPIVEDHFGGS